MYNDIKEILLEVLTSIVPIVLVIALIQLFLNHTSIIVFWQFIAGSILVAAGLFLFWLESGSVCCRSVK